ncbi:NACHT C-terminal helical domain 2-containing protein [Leptothoe spongobia]|uniref:NACHT C-terminal helical domain 2-containing protein n=1 Tax=Leptothoe spongobia TaxID=2651728 RepID=UPI0038990351
MPETHIEPTKIVDWQAFTDQLIQTYLNALHLHQELTALSSDDAESVARYLYSVKLILDCKNSSVRVSRQQWKAIESRLLTISEST